ILMEAVPQEIDISNIKSKILSIEHVKDIHDIHAWALSSKDIYFTGHIVLDNSLSVDEFDEILERIKVLLKEMGINHITVQPETEKYKCENVY
ncbi:MAG: cation transporter, partial [Aquificota bacterium]